MVGVKETKFFGIYKIDGKLATINLVPGERVYGEELVRVKDKEYRLWDCWRSKPAAAIKRGLKTFPLTKGWRILYLGVGSGTTASHLSDVIEKEGIIYGVDIGDRPIRDLICVSKARGNIVPILADCRKIEDYENLILEKVDFVYCDIADPQEVEIFIRNCKRFLKPGSCAAVAIKSRSINVIKPPKLVYQETRRRLEEDGFKILDFVTLDPYQKDHAFIVVGMK
ncbi:MAG: fibrillarin-like rRNA/tRNA 2'-O-methyltransferase [Candidatus Aenigmarchaeota archaeon]|nr:fibrillarin-like rRNA/tRNA 2'-O-methyltransferase [Candidatus Aenigmarchaeota archaeon]